MFYSIEFQYFVVAKNPIKPNFRKCKMNGMSNNKKKDLTGVFGEQFLQFKNKPKEAILFLKKQKRGECIAALHRDDIGDIDIVWGEVTDANKHLGFGLAHIIDKHEKTINELGFKIEDFIPIVVQYGEISIKRSDIEKYVFESKNFRFVVKREWNGVEKQLLLTSFDITKKPLKK